MKRFIGSILCVSVFFIGLGGLVEKAAAGFKSDERALAIIKQARAAIGGDAGIANVRALTITGRATQNFTLGGATRSEQGDLEINMQLPNGFSKTMKFGDGVKGDGEVRKEVNVLVRTIDGEAQMPDITAGDGKRNVVIMRKGEGEPLVVNTDEANADGEHKFFIRKGDGNPQELTTTDGKRIFVDKDLKFSTGAMRHNELFRTAFALLLTAPEGTDASYSFAGEADVDGSACNVIAITQTGVESFKLYLDKSTSLPRMMSYQAVKPLVFRFNKDDAKASGEKDNLTLVRRARTEAPETAEFQIKFSDYRTVGGLQLPFRSTQTIGGETDQTIDIANYEINPAGIAEKFKNDGHKVRMRTQKSQ